MGGRSVFAACRLGRSVLRSLLCFRCLQLGIVGIIWFWNRRASSSSNLLPRLIGASVVMLEFSRKSSWYIICLARTLYSYTHRLLSYHRRITKPAMQQMTSFIALSRYSFLSALDSPLLTSYHLIRTLCMRLIL